MRQFKEKIGRHIHSSKLPAQSYYRSFQEKLSEGSLSAETLAQVISATEEEKPEEIETGTFTSFRAQSRFDFDYPDPPEIPFVDAVQF